MEHSADDRLRTIAVRYPIDEALTLGLDVGIASVGSAIVQNGTEQRISFAGSRCFEAPEEPRTRRPSNQTRREKRLSRRVIRRRRRRMADIRALLVETGLLISGKPDCLHNRKGERALDPWSIRADALGRRLRDDELAVALLHIAKHRGFRSNKKADTGQNASDDAKKMLGAISANKELLARYRTVGEMVAKDEKFCHNKRNREGAYSHTHERGDLEREVRGIFRDQRRLRNARATAELEERYIKIAFHQIPLQDSEHLVGMCPFEPEERRAAHHAPSFEKFRFLAKLNTVRLRRPDGAPRRLTQEELRAAVGDFGRSGKSVTWNALAKKIGQSAGTAFDGVDEKRAKADVARSSGCAAGTKALNDALGPAGLNALGDRPELLDAIAAVIAFREDLVNIEDGLRQLDGLAPVICDALMEAVRAGCFGAFKRAGHISARAARTVLPHLLDGMVYSDACAAVGYDHTQTRRVGIEDIRNAVVQRSLREAIKQVETLIHEFGARPGRIIVELARDVGKSAQERDEIKTGLDNRNAEKNRHREEMKELLNLKEEPGDEDLRRFELWKEQNYRCIYTDKSIDCRDILSTSNAVQIDHVLPRSRSHDNSYPNLVLCFTGANQDKGQRTPREWYDEEKGKLGHGWWDTFEARVRALNIKGIKKRNLLMRDFHERAQGFVARNLNDTRYASRALLSALRHLYIEENEPDPAGEGYLGNVKRRLYARPGVITAILRRAWGLDELKDRSDDRHHALDALVCAAVRSEWLLNTLTIQYQRLEQENRARWAPPVPRPWDSFHDDAIQAFEGVFVSRSEKRRGRGQGHGATYYRVSSEDGRNITFERKAVEKLTEADLKRLKDADGGNRPVAAALAAWIERGRPKNDPPRSPKGDMIRKIHLKRGRTTGFDLNGGRVDNAGMVRVDVFSKPNKRGVDEFYLVPVYRHQVMNPTKCSAPPDQAITRGRVENSWEKIEADHRFMFSIYHDAYLEITRSDGAVEAGYFRGANRDTNSITVSPHNRREHRVGSIGVKTAQTFRKFHIDRLGRKYEIAQETRTWHGADCT